ncbi:hypothetical protein Mapa_007370 [Marchantia paleacea]|nr:hypothetical protein Mapa_007370 [Marchantia paleacea]
MASMGQADHLPTPCHLNGISRLNCSPPTGALNSPPISSFSNALAANDYREKYMMEMHPGYGRFFRNGSSGYGNQPSEMPQVWQLAGPAAEMHVLSQQENSIRGAANGMVANECGSEPVSRGSPGLLPTSSSELYGSTVVSGDWDQFVDSSVRYQSVLSSSSSPLSHNSPHAGSRGANEGAMIRELIGRLGGNGNGVSSLGGSPLVASPQRSGTGIDKALKLGNGWGSGEASKNMGLTVDPSKGGLALQGVGLATSHCLAHFASDPGFAERAARFSSFSNGNYSQPFPASDGGKTRSRQGSAQSSENTSNRQLLKTASCPSMSENAAGAKSPKEDPASSDNDDAGPETGAGAGAGADGEHDARDGEVEVKAGDKNLCRTASSLAAGDDDERMQAGSPVDEANEADEANVAQDMSSVGDAPGETCPSGVTHVTTATENLVKKRKGTPVEKSKDATSVTVSSPGVRETKTSDSDDVKAKRFKRGDVSKDKDDVKPKVERSSSETSGETSPRSTKDHSKPQEPPKPDYIHVRARRGQATDSHSLAERVRREKISERMKFLQDLVPGCSKVTGKAVMLDEIINYVQSLQRQVEFLSMKLAAVNPRLDFNIENLLAKEVSRSQGMIMGPETSYPQLHPQHQPQLQHGVPCGLEYPVQSLGNPSQVALRRSISAPIPAVIPREDGFADGVPTGVWDDGELQSIVMGFGHIRSLSSQALLHGHLPPGHMKVEL